MKAKMDIDRILSALRQELTKLQRRSSALDAWQLAEENNADDHQHGWRNCVRTRRLGQNGEGVHPAARSDRLPQEVTCPVLRDDPGPWDKSALSFKS